MKCLNLLLNQWRQLWTIRPWWAGTLSTPHLHSNKDQREKYKQKENNWKLEWKAILQVKTYWQWWSSVQHHKWNSTSCCLGILCVMSLICSTTHVAYEKIETHIFLCFSLYSCPNTSHFISGANFHLRGYPLKCLKVSIFMTSTWAILGLFCICALFFCKAVV